MSGITPPKGGPNAPFGAGFQPYAEAAKNFEPKNLAGVNDVDLDCLDLLTIPDDELTGSASSSSAPRPSCNLFKNDGTKPENPNGAGEQNPPPEYRFVLVSDVPAAGSTAPAPIPGEVIPPVAPLPLDEQIAFALRNMQKICDDGKPLDLTLDAIRLVAKDIIKLKAQADKAEKHKELLKAHEKICKIVAQAFAEDIDKRLQIMQEDCAKGKPLDVSLDALQKVAEDIRTLKIKGGLFQKGIELSKAHEKVLTVVAAALAEQTEIKLCAMMQTVLSGKPFDVTFEALLEVDRDIIVIKKQKGSAEKGKELAKTHEEIHNKVATALSDLIEAKLKVIIAQVDAGKAIEVPISVTEEIAADIRKLTIQAGKRDKGTEHFKTLETLSDQIAMAHVNEDLKKVEKPPLIGPEVELSERAKTYSEGNVKNGLTKLNNLLLMRSIRGDGHCLFRSSIAHILETWLPLPIGQRDAKLAKLDAKVTDLSKPSLAEKYLFFKKTLHYAAEKGLSYVEIISDEKTSDQLVAFMREFVCEHNRKTNNDVFASFVAAIPGNKSKDEYLNDMMSMQKAHYGDHPEIEAIHTLFDLNICVVDVAEFGKKREAGKESGAFRHFRAHDGMVELFLIYRPGHYDLGRMKHKRAEPAAADEPQRARGTRAFIEYAKEKGWIKV